MRSNETPDGDRVALKVGESPDGARVQITITHGTLGTDFSTERLLAERTIELQGGTMRDEIGSTTIELSAERLNGRSGASH